MAGWKPNGTIVFMLGKDGSGFVVGTNSYARNIYTKNLIYEYI
jgi:hypothetical protein